MSGIIEIEEIVQRIDPVKPHRLMGQGVGVSEILLVNFVYVVDARFDRRYPDGLQPVLVALKKQVGIICAGSASQLLQEILPRRRAKRAAVEGGNQIMFFTQN